MSGFVIPFPSLARPRLATGRAFDETVRAAQSEDEVLALMALRNASDQVPLSGDWTPTDGEAA